MGISRWATRARAAVAAHAAHDNPVAVGGESGTGKRLLASLIHQASSRGCSPFITASLETVSEESLEAALFGSVNACSSGRFYTRRGLVDKAEASTLYISGVRSVSPLMAAKLLRLVECRERARQGDTLFEKVDVRVIIGFNPPVDSGFDETHPTHFFSDSIKDVLMIPPLRKRKADLDPLCDFFTGEYCSQFGKEERRFSADARRLLAHYDWPGNVSELKRVIEHTVRTAPPPLIESSLLPPHISEGGHYSICPGLTNGSIRLKAEMDRFEYAAVCEALTRTHGVQKKAAELLGLRLTTLSSKIKRHRIDIEAFKAPVRS